jgi:hypothetical protein
MAFATDAQRLLLIKGCPQPLEFTVQIVTRTGAEIELSADDIDHALAISGDWLKRGALVVEVFRVDPQTGALRPTIGPVRAIETHVDVPASAPITIEQGLLTGDSFDRRRAALLLSDRIAVSEELTGKTKDHLAALAPEVRLHLYSVIAKLTKEPLA